MGSFHRHLDLSHANEVHQDHLLAKEMRQHGEIPANHFWQTVYRAYYRNDIAETGNDLRFRSHHRWVDDQFRHYDHLCLLRDHRTFGESGVLADTSPGILTAPPPSGLIPGITACNPPPPPSTVGTASVPEPSGLILLGIGLILSWWGWRRLRRGAGRQEPPSPARGGLRGAAGST